MIWQLRDSPLLPLLIILWAAIGPAPLAAEAVSKDPWAYYGVFRLQTGELFQGGLMEEGDQAFWTFFDPLHPEVGGLVYRQDSAARFSSLWRPGSRLEFSSKVDGIYRELSIRGRDGEIRGTRAVELERRDSELPVRDRRFGVSRLGVSLLIPDCPGPRALVVSIAGSGRNTRHSGMYSTFFLSQGLAVATYDKRDGDPQRDGWQEPDLVSIAEDAAVLLAWASEEEGIDPRRVGIVGSSQGGWTGSMAALEGRGADFLIVRAGPGVSELETHLYEVRQEYRDEGLRGRDLDKALQLSREIYRLAMAGEPIESTDSMVRPWLAEPWYRTAFGDLPVSERWSERWWRWAGTNMGVSAIPYLKRYAGPVLWFLAAEDENVPLVSSHAALRSAFESSPGDDHELVVLPEVGHDFVLDGSSPEARFAPGFWDRIASWLAERGLSDPGCLAASAAPAPGPVGG